MKAPRIAAGLAGALGTALALAPPPAQAQSYRCIDADGRRIYGEVIPRACVGRPVEQLSPQGIVIRRIDPPLTDAERKAKADEEQKKRDAAELARLRARRDRALLATYPDLEAIEAARQRTLHSVEREIAAIESTMARIRERQDKLSKEFDAYQAKRAKAPPNLHEDIRQVAVELAAQQNLLAAKARDVEAINARYDEDQRRYTELTARR